MNEPMSLQAFGAATASPAHGPTYDDDFHGWAMAQADHIRAGRSHLLDRYNLAEEIQDLAKSEQRAAESALRIIMLHILKWHVQPERRGRSWSASIATQRLAYRAIIDASPSLAARAGELRLKAFQRARIEAAGEMDLPVASVPDTVPDWPIILDVPFEVD